MCELANQVLEVLQVATLTAGELQAVLECDSNALDSVLDDMTDCALLQVLDAQSDACRYRLATLPLAAPSLPDVMIPCSLLQQ